MKRMLLVLAALAFAGAAVNGLEAQVRFGGQLSWADDADLGIGGRLEYAPKSIFKDAPVMSAASFDVFFPGNNITYLEVNYNVWYHFTAESVTPYAGGGLNLAYASVSGGGSDTQLGLNLGGGVRFKTKGKLTPFVEARFELSGGEQFVLTGGLLF